MVRDTALVDRRWLVPASIVALATGLRAWRLRAKSLWIDEAASLYYVRHHDLVGLWSEVLGQEPHPPLYYTLLDGWTSVAGTSPAALRAPSVLFGAAAVALTFLLARRLADRGTAVLASLLVALSGFHVHAAQQARMYTLLTAASVLSMWLFVRALERPEGSRLAAWVASALLLGYAHAYGLFVLGAQGLAFARSRWPELASPERRAWSRSWGLIGAGLVPWVLAVAYGMVAGSTAGRIGWITAPSGWALARLPAHVIGIDRVLGGQATVVVSLSVAVGLGLGWWSLRGEEGALGSRGGEAAGLLGLWVVVALVGPFLVSHLVVPIFLARYATAASPALFVLLARGARSLGSPAAVVVSLGLVAGTAAGLAGVYRGDLHEPWDEAAGIVGSRAQPGEVVLVAEHRPGSVETRTAFTYYFDRSDVPVAGITGEIPRGELVDHVDERDSLWLVLSRATDRGRERVDGILAEQGYAVENSWEPSSIEVRRYERTRSPFRTSTAGWRDPRRSRTSRRGCRCSWRGS